MASHLDLLASSCCGELDPPNIMTPPLAQRLRAFTLIELLTVIVVVGLLALLLLPMKGSSQRVHAIARCASNQKQISLGFLVLMNDQDQTQFPFRIGWWQGGSGRGAVGSTNAGPASQPPTWVTDGTVDQAWFQFAWLSNELLNPLVLVCPADQLARGASDFSTQPGQGLLHPELRNQAVSYFLALEARTVRTPQAGIQVPDAGEVCGEVLLLGDLNLDVTRPPAPPECSSRLRANAAVEGTSNPQWRQQPRMGHGAQGNLAFSDGSVQRTSHRDLREFLNESDDGGAVHFLFPRFP